MRSTRPLYRYITKFSQQFHKQVQRTKDMMRAEVGGRSQSRFRENFMNNKKTQLRLYPTIFAMALILAVLGPQIPYLQREPDRPPAAGLSIVSIEPDPANCTIAADCVIAVNIKWAGNDDNDLYVLLLPDPNDEGQAWWTQDLPTQTGEGEWTVSKVYIGEPGDRSGLPFRICAIVTTESLHPGDHWQQNKVTSWAKAEACRDITRGSAS
jgi:hypothetical protein